MFQRSFLTYFCKCQILSSASKTRMLNQPTVISRLRFCQSSSDDSNNKKKKLSKNIDELTASIPRKYDVFKDAESPIILDVDEERDLQMQDTTVASAMLRTYSKEDEFNGISLKRGITGVFDIEELVEILRRDRAQDIFVAAIPATLRYVDYIVVVTGKSTRHMLAMAEFVRKAFKRKRGPNDIIPRIEGANCEDWIALDLGNIALHVFSKSARQVYDLDSLWGIGSEHDELCNQPEDPLIALLQQHSVYLGDMAPKETLG